MRCLLFQIPNSDQIINAKKSLFQLGTYQIPFLDYNFGARNVYVSDADWYLSFISSVYLNFVSPLRRLKGCLLLKISQIRFFSAEYQEDIISYENLQVTWKKNTHVTLKPESAEMNQISKPISAGKSQVSTLEIGKRVNQIGPFE